MQARRDEAKTMACTAQAGGWRADARVDARLSVAAPALACLALVAGFVLLGFA